MDHKTLVISARKRSPKHTLRFLKSFAESAIRGKKINDTILDGYKKSTRAYQITKSQGETEVPLHLAGETGEKPRTDGTFPTLFDSDGKLSSAVTM